MSFQQNIYELKQQQQLWPNLNIRIYYAQNKQTVVVIYH